MSEAATQYKKQDGTLSLSQDGKTVSWKAAAASSPALTITVADITNLQQTPATAAKASIKIVVQRPPAAAENHTFQFTSPSARAEQQAITGSLRKWIEAAKQPQNTPTPAATPTPRPDNGGGASATMAFAQTAATSAAKAPDSPYDDAKLLQDLNLQKELLNANATLKQRFDQAVRDKPESISITQIITQFWTTRIQLLRSYSVERSQTQGTYNVLSEVKPKEVDGVTKLNLSKEQIQLIFNQHPLVRRVYSENVPALSEGEFWSRFFISRLFKKLKGEKIKDLDPVDAKLDKYLHLEDDDGLAQQAEQAVPRFIDVEGNEQNHSQRQGNRPDFTMRLDKAPILRVLNRMSEKMMAEIPPIDGDAHAPAGMDEETFQQLQLRDLQLAADDNRVVLKIQDQSQLFRNEQNVHTSTSASTYAKRTPAQVISTVNHDVQKVAGSRLDLAAAIGVDEDSSSDEDEAPTKKKPRVGSRSTRTAATSQIMKAIRQRHLHNDESALNPAAASSGLAEKMGLSQAVFDNMSMTHNTTVEFLHYFWTVFLSGDADRAGEVQKLVETLDKSLDRIKAVAQTAESERQARVDQRRKEIDEFNQRASGRKRKFDPNNIKGGAKAVNEIMNPLLRAINAATQHYRKVYQEQMAASTQLSAP